MAKSIQDGQSQNSDILTSKQDVVGSSPIARSIISNSIAVHFDPDPET